MGNETKNDVLGLDFVARSHQDRARSIALRSSRTLPGQLCCDQNVQGLRG